MPDTGKQKVVVVGYGWIGQANAVALTKMGYSVAYFDPSDSIDLHYQAESQKEYDAVTRLGSTFEWEQHKPWYIICVGDRVNMTTGEQDVSFIRKALDSVQKAKGRIILRSTVLPQHLATMQFDIYLPEFLHEQFAIEECENPFLFIVGKEHPTQQEPDFFAEWERRAPKVFRGTPREASLLKYLSNIWNSLRVAFINEFGDVIADPKKEHGLAQINRMINFMFENKSYLRYGRAYDGHCLPKDTMAFFTAHKKDHNVALIEATHISNDRHQKAIEGADFIHKWYSSWEDDRFLHSRMEEFEQWVRDNSFLKPFRPVFKQVKHGIEFFMPDRSHEEITTIWNERAKENPLYYSNSRTPSGSSVTEEEFFATGATDFDHFVSSDRKLQELLQPTAKHTVYEVGVGAGRMIPSFALTFNRVVGADISPVMLEQARSRVKRFDNVELREILDATLPGEDGMATFVFSYQTLQHVPSKKQLDILIREIYRILKKGGIAKLQFRTGKGLSKWAWSYGVSLTPAQARSLLEQNGFTVHYDMTEGSKHLWVLAEK